DMSDEQGYLKSASTGGLGVEDAWAKLDTLFPDIKLRGQHTMVVDQEYDWNFDHEILPVKDIGNYLIGVSSAAWAGYDESDGKGFSHNINYGTAVLGIISAQGDDIAKGIKGVVPATEIRVAPIGPGTGAMWDGVHL
ncbi:MAG: hypothetical protein HY739_06515, partial [Desulfobacterales bacterium]|nr:hypothetical protein [Desulfobacterales bacterium]